MHLSYFNTKVYPLKYTTPLRVVLEYYNIYNLYCNRLILNQKLMNINLFFYSVWIRLFGYDRSMCFLHENN